jgi:hypothetical protein
MKKNSNRLEKQGNKERRKVVCSGRTSRNKTTMHACNIIQPNQSCLYPNKSSQQFTLVFGLLILMIYSYSKKIFSSVCNCGQT